MKSFPGTVKITGLIILCIVLVQACAHDLVQSHSRELVKVLRGAQVKEPANFCGNINSKVTSAAFYVFVVIGDNGNVIDRCCGPVDCKKSTLNVKVDKITQSSAAEGDGSARWGSHVTQRIYSYESKDIKAVEDELKTKQ